MLSLPDFKEKQILYIKTERKSDDKIKFWNDNIKFTRNGETVNQVSCHKIFAIFLIGDLSITSEIIKKCGRYGISIYFLNYSLEEYASIAPESEGNFLLRTKQYNFCQELKISKCLLINKITNQLTLVKDPKKSIADLVNQIKKARGNKELLGIEGNISKTYFSRMFEDIGWSGRIPRAKIDIQNLLLDIGYYYLFNFIDALLRNYGFDVYKGFYHKEFYLRKSLACDIMEPFRIIIDRQLIKSYHLKQIKSSDFICKNGSYQIKTGQSLKYSEFFVSAILNEKERIHQYVKEFYYFIIGKRDDFPVFKTKR